nr:hypothetical protein [Bacteroidota bacterium]
IANNFHSSLRNPLELLGNLNLTYKRNINKKHFLIADISNFSISKDLGNGWHKGIQYQSASLGYGYLLSVQKLQAMAFANVPYRYKGSEYFIYFEPNDGLWTCIGPTYIHAPTHSIGIGAGIDLNYFLLKNWAIGAKVQYQYFPFDNREFMGSDMDKFRNFAQKTIQTPDLFLLQLKVAYQFNLLRKNNTN